MLIESKELYLCDGCGEELEEPSEMKIVLDYGSTDPCFRGSGIEALQVEYEIEDDSEYEDTLQQPDYHYCDDCQCDFKGYMKKFEIAARAKRAAILLELQARDNT